MLQKVGIQDIFPFGIVKICKAQPDNLLDDIRKLRTETYDSKLTAFGLPNKWQELKPAVIKSYPGLAKLVYFCEPMIDSVDMSVEKDNISIRRRFNRKWHSIWDEVGRSMELSDADKEIVDGVGICIAEMDEESVPKDIHDFYNLVLKWTVVSQNEVTLKEYGLTVEYALSALIVYDSSEFVSFVEAL